MRRGRTASAITALLLISVLTSCGDQSTNGVTEFNTVNVTAAAEASQNPLLSDLAKWSGTPCGAASAYSIENDVVNFTITSTQNISQGTAAPLLLQSASIRFSPADTLSPSLPPLFSPIYQNLNGYIVPAGGTLSVPIEIATHQLKDYFGPTLICTNLVYSYNATITFDAVEQGTGKFGKITAGMTVRFTDFAD